jgi:hypothetical protein
VTQLVVQYCGSLDPDGRVHVSGSSRSETVSWRDSRSEAQGQVDSRLTRIDVKSFRIALP